MALHPGSDRVMNYYSAVVLLSRRARYRLHHSRDWQDRSLLTDLKHSVYLGRTCDPHRRAREWRLQAGNSLGGSLRRLDKMGFVQGKDYLTAARVWFRFKGAKNTPQRAWDLPESAFKIMCARDPLMLIDQNVEALCDPNEPPVTTKDVCCRWSYRKCTLMAHAMLRVAVCGK